LCEPFLVPFFGEREGQSPRCHSIDAPLPTVTGQGAGALIQPFLVQFKGTRPDQLPGTAQSIEQPLNTITAGGGNFGICEPFLMQMSQSGSNGDRLRPASQPMPTITTADDLAVVEPFLVSYYSNGGPRSVDEPLDTVTTRDRFALVTIHGRTCLLDIRFRMLQPNELAAAMSFPTGYHFAGNRGEQVKQIGNAVDGRMARALCLEILGWL
jgi:DNA (cytosine-5)-methyltransferase 1